MLSVFLPSFFRSSSVWAEAAVASAKIPAIAAKRVMRLLPFVHGRCSACCDDVIVSGFAADAALQFLGSRNARRARMHSGAMDKVGGTRPPFAHSARQNGLCSNTVRV